MNNRFASVTLAITLVCSVGATSVLANAPTQTATTTDVPVKPAAATEPPARNEAKPNEKLKAGITKLVADTKAGKGKLTTRTQTQPAMSNNLSKRTKIALVVGIAVVVVAVIVVIHEKNHLFDDFRLGN